jgi:hypothetical protein
MVINLISQFLLLLFSSEHSKLLKSRVLLPHGIAFVSYSLHQPYKAKEDLGFSEIAESEFGFDAQELFTQNNA